MQLQVDPAAAVTLAADHSVNRRTRPRSPLVVRPATTDLECSSVLASLAAVTFHRSKQHLGIS